MIQTREELDPGQTAQGTPAPGSTETAEISVPDRPRLAPGVELVGEMQGTGFVDRQWLIQSDSRYIQLSELLYRVAEQIDGKRNLEQIADGVTEATDWAVTAQNVQQLIQTRFIPMGLVASADGAPVQQVEGWRSPLQVNLRVKAIGPRVIDPITGVLRVVFAPPILIPLLIVIAFAHGWLYFSHGLTAPIAAVLLAPALLPVTAAIVVLSGVAHEFGHASALRYGGGRVRSMGAGLYLFYPIFYTDLTDGYRLGRWARVRADLGGFYFHLIFALGLIVLYMASGMEFLLVAVLVINLDILYQCLIFVRFDGYWALADATGIPDFFSQMGGLLRSVLPLRGHRANRLPRLKPWVKAIFLVYTLITIPVLALILIPMFRAIPTIATVAGNSFRLLAGDFANARGAGDGPGMGAAAAQMIFLGIPLLGMAYVQFSLVRKLIGAVWAWSKPTPQRRLIGALGGATVVGVVAFFWMPQVQLSTASANEPSGVETFEVEGRSHVRTSVSYQQNPPVGGNHFPIWQNCGFYDSPVTNENAVHSLEHGAVWITYRPDLPEVQVNALRELAHSRDHILVSPYADLPAAVVASAWGKQLRLDSVSDPRLEQFVSAYRLGRQTPEPGERCDGGLGEPK